MAIKQICVLVAFFVLIVDAAGFTWKNCDSKSPVQIKKLTTTPYPIKLKAGTNVNVLAKIDVKGYAGLKYNLHTKVHRKGWFGIWIPIPCIGGRIGSCDIVGNPKLTCENMKVLINEQKCPLPRQLLVFKRQKVIPKISIPSWLTSGQYRVRADLIGAISKKRIACLEAHVALA